MITKHLPLCERCKRPFKQNDLFYILGSMFVCRDCFSKSDQMKIPKKDFYEQNTLNFQDVELEEDNNNEERDD